MMTNDISDRLRHQRCRNRMMEELACLVDWEDTLFFPGLGEYFQALFDWAPDYPEFPPNTAITNDEKTALFEVLKLVDEACRDTSASVTKDDFVKSGWPQRIAMTARSALSLMEMRGKFSEEQEESEPSGLKAPTP